MYDFKKIEQDARQYWEDHKIFQKSLDKTRGGKRFVFWEGPPTANGLPHIGHFLTRIYKDLYGRYKTMQGFFVLRKAGWDTHGLPVEIEIEKELGFTNKKQIEEYGIAKFNRKARESVWKYKGQWEDMSRKMGFWIDMSDPYITYDNKYMESVWNILAEIWDKGLMYQAHKVVPFCVRCGTSLSAHEVAQGYKKVTERSVFVKFRVKPDSLVTVNCKLETGNSLYILAWTTTPWTLPGNVALAVGSEVKYIFATQGMDTYVVAADLAEKVLGNGYTIEKEVSGKELVGLEYEPLFDVAELKSEKSYRVYPADFVTTQEGTGVVHTAVMYGEDDYNLGTHVGLPKFHTVDEQGKFVAAVGPDLAGKFVKSKTTEDLIIKQLEIKNFMFKIENFEHDYPFCWRCDTPLLYYAKTSWFIKTSAVNKDLVANNSTVNWIPAHVRDGRFGQWIREGKDWNLSRERYWGTPLPIWKCDQCDHATTIGSIKELEKLSLSSKNTYFVMRHGYTTRHEEGDPIINSHLEKDTYHLTEKGKVAVEQSAELLKMEGIDVIYASPFIRTKETAGIVAKALHKTITLDERLVEIGHGLVAEGKPHSSTHRIVEHTSMNLKEEGGETWNDVRLRVMSFMNEMEATYKNKKILIVTHMDPMWMLSKIGEGLTEKEIIDRGRDENTSRWGWLPRLAEAKKLLWRKIPRNEYGELDLHRPFIDNVTIKCPKCKSKMKKIPDLIDVWFDSGAMPYAQWHYPFGDKKNFRSQFPADFIVEGIDQTRGWFYTLLAISTLLGRGAPYKNVMVLGFTLDEKGVKMSKSKGNYVPVMEFMETHGVDILRWYFLSSMAIGEDKAVVNREIEDKLKGFFFTLQNCIRFYELYTTPANHADPVGKLNGLDKWLLSRFNRLLQSVTTKLDTYDVTAAAREIEYFVIEDLSNWWVRRSRKRREALPLLRLILLELARMLAPFTPFLAEDMWARLGGREVSSFKFQVSSESVHLAGWPKLFKKYIDDKLESEMASAREIIARGLALRKEKQLKVRQPLESVSVKRDKLPRDIELLIKDELNVKHVRYGAVHPEDVTLNTELTPGLVREGYAREMMRMIQDMRKEAKYRMEDMVTVHWSGDQPAVVKAIEQYAEDIKKDTYLSVLERRGKDTTQPYDLEKESDIAPDKKIWIGIRK